MVEVKDAIQSKLLLDRILTNFIVDLDPCSNIDHKVFFASLFISAVNNRRSYHFLFPRRPVITVAMVDRPPLQSRHRFRAGFPDARVVVRVMGFTAPQFGNGFLSVVIVPSLLSGVFYAL
nr:hypothetical protein Iba_chr05eCG8920 [Ipomoea batatas]